MKVTKVRKHFNECDFCDDIYLECSRLRTFSYLCTFQMTSGTSIWIDLDRSRDSEGHYGILLLPFIQKFRENNFFTKHSVEITKIYSHLTLIWRKFRESNGFTNKITKFFFSYSMVECLNVFLIEEKMK